MITVKGKEHRTIEDAASDFGFSTKAVHGWIKKGIISKPPQVEYGARLVSVFPESYMRDARKELETYRQGRQRGESRKPT